MAETACSGVVGVARGPLAGELQTPPLAISPTSRVIRGWEREIPARGRGSVGGSLTIWPAYEAAAVLRRILAAVDRGELDAPARLYAALQGAVAAWEPLERRRRWRPLGTLRGSAHGAWATPVKAAGRDLYLLYRLARSSS
jgi:hypothetical protein